MPIVPSLLAGVLYALLATTRWGELNGRALRSLYRAFDVAAPPIVLFLAIGMLLAAVKLPGAKSALTPIVSAISPAGAIGFVVVFAVLVPLCLFRGPLTVFGLGAGVAGVLVSGGIDPMPAVVGMMASYNQVFSVSDPTSTQTVWSAQYAGVRPEKAMISTLPYTWVGRARRAGAHGGAVPVTTPMTPVTLRAVDGVALDARWHPAIGPAVVLAHGIPGDLTEHGLVDALSARLAGRGVAVLRFSFRGHGASSGRPGAR